ncbi:MAG: hypothetical protein OXH52_16715 [Gammaproteobacteria bacterium]|nr:hypothetical protein [Gammaproteobacteria bacterium]
MEQTLPGASAIMSGCSMVDERVPGSARALAHMTCHEIRRDRTRDVFHPAQAPVSPIPPVPSRPSHPSRVLRVDRHYVRFCGASP